MEVISTVALNFTAQRQLAAATDYTASSSGEIIPPNARA
jgi:hypothetical protein